MTFEQVLRAAEKVTRAVVEYGGDRVRPQALHHNTKKPMALDRLSHVLHLAEEVAKMDAEKDLVRARCTLAFMQGALMGMGLLTPVQVREMNR